MVIECSFCSKRIEQYEVSFAVTFEQSMFVGEDELEVLEADELRRWCQNCDNNLLLGEKISNINNNLKRELHYSFF